MLIYEYKLDGSKAQYQAIDEAMRIVQFIRNKCLRLAIQFGRVYEIERAMQVATVQLNHRAKPWIWGRPPRTRRHLHRLFCYRL